MFPLVRMAFRSRPHILAPTLLPDRSDKTVIIATYFPLRTIGLLLTALHVGPGNSEQGLCAISKDMDY